MSHRHPQAPTPPTWMAPCNGCGVCCSAETCPLGRIIFLQKCGPCPALMWDNAISCYRCGLSSHPENYLPWLPLLIRPLLIRLCRRWIAVGYGCDSADANV